MSRPVNRMRAVHPGEVLREEYLTPIRLSVNALAMALGVPATRIHEIVKERRGITADTAERLARYFGGDAASWLALQADYDLKTLATRKDIARKMILLVRSINSNFPGTGVFPEGNQEVTCYTCHRGDAHPLSVGNRAYDMPANK